MTRKNVVIGILLLIVIFLFALPLYLFRNYLRIGYKFLNPDYTKVEKQGKIVSILVLGKGGEGHTAPDLTDTIMNVFLNTESKKISLLPLPRDIWDQDLRAKLNTAYYWGKKKGGNGLDLASESVNKITGIKPSYVAVVDFTLFKDLIDVIGGIEVDVEREFTDTKYPISGRENDTCGEEKLPISKRTYSCRYETITFKKGLQKMDGEIALKFVRSRNAQGDEGTDIAREARQQKIIAGIKNKLSSQEVVLNPEKLNAIITTLVSKIETNIDMDTSIVLARMFAESKDNIQGLVIPENLLIASTNNPKYDRQYVFVSPTGNWEKLQEWISQQI